MQIIIDTHIFLWVLFEPAKLNKTKRLLLEDLSNTIYVSAISIAELVIKDSIGKLKIEFDPIAMAKKSGFLLLDFTAQAALQLKNMPYYHKDPFDRMIIAQSLSDDFFIMTEDSKFTQYGCKLL